MLERQNKMCRLLLKLEKQVEHNNIVPPNEDVDMELPIITTDEELGDLERQLGGPDRASLVISSDISDKLSLWFGSCVFL